MAPGLELVTRQRQTRVHDYDHKASAVYYTFTVTYNKKGYAAFLSRRESITSERPTSFPKKIPPCLSRDSNPNSLCYKPRAISTILTGRQTYPDDGLRNFQRRSSEENDASPSKLWLKDFEPRQM
ncbi:hypothetical protein TNCV_3330591 [Trichonephila clavipes]|nr:hypothetical protein TNCV_3330591 [Trichonephila clavipes]